MKKSKSESTPRRDTAIEGYDAVSGQEGKLRPGREEFTTEWKEESWQFASAANKDKFVADPERYAPQFDGACAFATSLGKDAPGSPRHSLVRDGKLYFTLNPVARLLFRLLPGRAEKAHAHWLSRVSSSG